MKIEAVYEVKGTIFKISIISNRFKRFRISIRSKLNGRAFLGRQYMLFRWLLVHDRSVWTRLCGTYDFFSAAGCHRVALFIPKFCRGEMLNLSKKKFSRFLRAFHYVPFRVVWWIDSSYDCDLSKSMHVTMTLLGRRMTTVLSSMYFKTVPFLRKFRQTSWAALARPRRFETYDWRMQNGSFVPSPIAGSINNPEGHEARKSKARQW